MKLTLYILMALRGIIAVVGTLECVRLVVSGKNTQDEHTVCDFVNIFSGCKSFSCHKRNYKFLFYVCIFNDHLVFSNSGNIVHTSR